MASSDFETALISAVIENRDFRTLVKQKIDKSFFFTPYNTACFEWLTAWYTNPEYGDTPSWDTFLDAFPEFSPITLEDSIVALCDRVREKKLYTDIAGGLSTIGNTTMGDPRAGLEMFKSLASELSAKHTIDRTIDIRNEVDSVLSRYLQMKAQGTQLRGKPYPWPALNDATLGLRDEQLVLFYGLPKTKKTWLLLAVAEHIRQTGGVPLILSQEMPTEDMVNRYVAMTTGLDYDRFCRGSLYPEEELEFFGNCEAFKEQPPVYITQISTVNKACIPDIMAQIDEYRPTVLLIDSIHYLTPTYEWRDISLFITNLRGILKDRHIPCVATTHAQPQSKKASLMDAATDFAYASAYHKNCDVAVRVTADNANKRNKEVCLFTSAIREGKSALFTVNMQLAYNLTQKAVKVVDDDELDMDDDSDQRA